MKKILHWKWLPLAGVIVVVVALLIGFGVARSMSTQSEHEQTANTSKSKESKKPDGLGSEDESWTHPPAFAVDAATHVVEETLIWSKANGHTMPVSVKALETAGMSKECAAAYVPVWDSVFELTRGGAPIPVGEMLKPTATVADVSGKAPNRVWTFRVTARVLPHWEDKDGVTQTFPEETDAWQVSVSETSGKVEKFVEPTQEELGFRIPTDLVADTKGLKY